MIKAKVTFNGEDYEGELIKLDATMDYLTTKVVRYTGSININEIIMIRFNDIPIEDIEIYKVEL